MESSALVRELLSKTGIPASDDEIALLADWYPAAHRAAAGLYSVPVAIGLPAAMPHPVPPAADARPT
jgi:hypothetical protein